MKEGHVIYFVWRARRAPYPKPCCGSGGAVRPGADRRQAQAKAVEGWEINSRSPILYVPNFVTLYQLMGEPLSATYEGGSLDTRATYWCGLCSNATCCKTIAFSVSPPALTGVPTRRAKGQQVWFG
jgi:hypothetical protein